ncbi:MAG TPA: pilus assembly protein PilP [Sedimenticola thiotaurini]|uniref:Pilus assembly protein PilP n=1 Tax=Sedimenticola thiotaurini TaxID=1543721 RepID=A0A831RMR4_9GAMM|nr:pilus assembly protein PilP [Sedimenticola thiotaurini]
MSIGTSTPVRLLFTLALSGLLTGCFTQDMSDLRRYVDEVKARKQGYIEPLPEIKQVETFAYVPGDRRSPFVPSSQGEEETQKPSSNGIAPDPNRRKEELENYSLDSLRMVGTLKQGDVMWALVQTSDSTIYRVKAGNYMGRNHGQITRIDENDIELTEIVPDGQGGYLERQASLALKEDQG